MITLPTRVLIRTLGLALFLSPLAAALPVEPSSHCVLLDDGAAGDGNIDMVFVPSSLFTEVGPGSVFADAVDRFVSEVRSFAFPFVGRPRLFRLDKIDPEDGCHIQDSAGVCTVTAIDTLATEQCVGFSRIRGGMEVVVFPDVFFAYGDLAQGRVWIGANHYRVLIHEFGHAFTNLEDEYVRPVNCSLFPSSPQMFANCASLAPGQTCQDKWGDLLGSGTVDCVPGCSSPCWYRPTDSCIMGDNLLDHWCAVCAREVINRAAEIARLNCNLECERSVVRSEPRAGRPITIGPRD